MKRSQLRLFFDFLGKFLLLLNDTGQKAAFGKMHEAGFLDALKTFEKAIHATCRIPPVPAQGTGFARVGTKGYERITFHREDRNCTRSDFTLKRVMAGSPLAGGCFLGKTLALKRTP